MIIFYNMKTSSDKHINSLLKNSRSSIINRIIGNKFSAFIKEHKCTEIEELLIKDENKYSQKRCKKINSTSRISNGDIN